MRLKREDIASPEEYDTYEEAIAWSLYYLLHEQVNTREQLEYLYEVSCDHCHITEAHLDRIWQRL